MSDPASSQRTAGDRGGRQPRAMIHKRILDAAADRPDASLEALATDVSGASVSLVERVLREYGDPTPSHPDSSDATGDPESPVESTQESLDESPATQMSHQSIADDGEATPDPTDLDAKQRRTLRAIYDHPDATQSELADVLDVSAPTVSNRVNGIPGFSWEARREYVTSLFDGSTADESVVDEPATDEPAMEKSTADEPTADEQATDGAGVRDERLESLAADVAALEAEVASLADGLQDQSSDDAFTDPELVHKVVHACVHSDRISEDEEVQILESILS